MYDVFLFVIYRGFDLQPSKVVLDVSRESYKTRISACWPKWDNIPAHIVECIWQDVLVSIYIFMSLIFNDSILLLFDDDNLIFDFLFFCEIQAQLDIQTEDLMLARHYWMQKMRKNYRDTISAVKAKRKQPQWMGDSVWEGFKKYWDSDDAKVTVLIKLILNMKNIWLINNVLNFNCTG